MKKLLIVLIFLSLGPGIFAQKKFFDSAVSQRQVIVGIRGGVNFNTFGHKLERVWEGNPKKEIHTGWNIGIVFDVPILESLYFQPGAFYKTKGFKLTEKTHAYDRLVKGRAAFVEFPLLFSYRYNIRKDIQFEFNLGPYIGCGLAGNVKDIEYSYLLPDDEGKEGLDSDFATGNTITERDMFGDELDSSFGVRKTDIGLCFGTGITVNRFYIGFQYDMGLTNLANKVCWKPGTSFKTRSATILIGFNLFRK